MAYIIALEHFMVAYPNDWPVSAQAPTLEGIKKVTSYSGSPSLRPKSKYTAAYCGKASLLDANNPAAKPAPGRIYILKP